jgi:DNA-binding FadR family transcriptional regulator
MAQEPGDHPAPRTYLTRHADVGDSRAAAIATRIRHDIVTAGWPVGSVLGSEPDLLERYGVSRPVLREAGRILESQRVARMRRGPRGGLVVLEPDGSALTDAAALYLEYLDVDPSFVHEARVSIELTCAERAASRVSEADIERLRALVRDEPARLSGDRGLDVQNFHVLVAELSGNPVLHLFVGMLTTLTRQRAAEDIDRLMREDPRRQTVHRDHERITEAIAAGDAALARHRMQRHLVSPPVEN